MQTLDELLSQEPHATFHDATIVELQHDPVARSASLTADLCVGNPDAASPVEQARRRRGRLTFGGVRLWRVEGQGPAGSVPGDWSTAEGPIAEANTELGRALGRDFGAEPFCWYFYFSDTNAFLYWTAQNVAFDWQGSTQPSGDKR